MPKLIFAKNGSDTRGQLYKIARDQNHIDNNADWSQDLYDIVEVSQSDYDNVKLNLKGVLWDGTNVTYEDIAYDQHDEDHAGHKTHTLNHINEWLEENSSKPFATNVTTYRDYVNTLDVSSIPNNESFEKWINDQGQEVVSLFELL